MSYRIALVAAFGGLLALASADAQPIINGTLAGDAAAYGPALSIQNTDTQFGDATNGDPRFANGGSEIDQAFGTIANGRLYMLITGNLESNFNKLSVFFDSVSGGVNQIVGANLPVGVDGFCCGGFTTTDGALQRMDGLKFDAGFDADHFLTFSNGNENNGTGGLTFWALTAHFAQLNNGTSGLVSRVGMQLNASGSEPGLGQGVPVDQSNNTCPSPYAACTIPEHEFVEPWDPMIDPSNSRNHRDMLNTVDLRMAINNSNTQGVVGTGVGPWNTIGNPQDVITGVEFSIPLSQLGNPAPGSTIRVAAFVNGGGHNYASNQFIGDGILQANLGGDGVGGFTGTMNGVDLSTIDGNQFVSLTVPSSGLAGDFNNDGLFNCSDINALTGAIAGGSNPTAFDLNGDGSVNLVDRDQWLSIAGGANIGPGRPYRLGDANLDGVVDGSDFGIWNGNKFTSTSAWCSGDFNADGVVDGSDFGIWNGNKFTASDGGVVPEPSSVAGLLLLLGWIAARRRS